MHMQACTILRTGFFRQLRAVRSFIEASNCPIDFDILYKSGADVEEKGLAPKD